MSSLDRLSGDAQVFREKTWASRVHLHRSDPADFVDLLSLADVDHLLTSVALRAPVLRLAQDGQVIASAHFTRTASMSGAPLTGLVDGRKVLDLFDAGATVVLQGLHRYWPPLTRLVRELELELGHPCQANAYLTPPGAQGFARHSDSHDVFVFQTHGRKLWEVLDTVGGDDEVREVLLEPGVSMYLPTGTPHSARSQNDVSLHVTLGINQLTRRDVLRRITAQLLADEEFDAPLPAGTLDHPDELVAALRSGVADLASRLAAVDVEAQARTHVSDFLTGRASTLAGGLTDRVRLGELGDGTTLERRETAACVLREEDGRLVVLLGDRALRMPLRLRPPLELIRDRPLFRVDELSPWLDQGSRLVVVSRLVREGLLRIRG